jgi:thiol:disulfide interchange protein DsbD
MLLLNLISCIYSTVTISTSNYQGHLAINFKNEPEYHTYWSIPGNVGRATKISFKLNGNPVDIPLFEWPIPTVLEENGYTSYALFDEYSFFYNTSALSGDLSILIEWASCKDTCIPGKTKIEATLKNGVLVSPITPIDEKVLETRFNSLPKKSDKDLPIYLERIRNSFKLTYQSNSGVLIPYGEDNLRIIPTPDKSFIIDIKGGFPQKLKFLHLNGDAEAITKNFKDIPLINPYTILSFFPFVLMAFIGGLILNLMPCIFPVISLKVLSIVKSRKYTHLVYALGILFSFLILGVIIYIFNYTTAAFGWGFQFQSPLFLGATALIFFILALNLFDLFYIPVKISLQLKETYLYDFLAGIITTVMATPCSAPFMGVAITVALTAPPFFSIIIFFFLGLGLSFPFLLLFFFPKLLKKLPHSGPWMVTFKKIMGFLFLLSFLWLYNLYFEITGFGNFLIYSIILLLLWFNIYLKKLILMITSIIITIIILIPNHPQKWEPWSAALWQKYYRNQDTVLIAVGAKWCLTCLVNKPILNSKSFRDFVKKHRVKLLEADLTTANQELSNWLAGFGRYSIPTYILLKNGQIFTEESPLFLNLK